jgi:hypothetical protein
MSAYIGLDVHKDWSFAMSSTRLVELLFGESLRMACFKFPSAAGWLVGSSLAQS